MAIFVIGDLHLSFDERIDKPMDIYGGSWENHEERLKSDWIEKVNDNDTVIIAGDVSWGLKLDEAMADLKWIDELPGKKVIIKGNHDLWWCGIGKLNSLFETVSFLHNDAYIIDIIDENESKEKIAICGTRGWVCPGSEGFTAEDEKIYRREVLRLEASLKKAVQSDVNRIIGVLHYPPTNDKKQGSDFTRLFTEYGASAVYYGHLHGNDAINNRDTISFNCVKYRLVSLDAVDCTLVKVL